MSGRRRLSEEECALWQGFARSITPLHRTEEPAASTAAAAARSKPGAERPKSARKPPPPPSDIRPTPAPVRQLPLAPLDRRLKQRVARGREPIDGRIDLHGHTQRQAHGELLRFLQRAQSDGARMVLVVTGKGGNRGTGERDAAIERGVLRRQVPLWLALPEFRSFVLSFEDAHVGHGGQGALYVRLRRPR